jgi:hypothetical protein
MGLIGLIKKGMIFVFD